MKQNLKPLFIFELANNHNGSVERGIKIITDINEQVRNYRQYFNFAFKLQYRNLDTFIHPEFKNKNDIESIKKFNDTKLSEDELFTLKNEITKQGFISICTAFDEDSVDLIEKQGYDIIKIASCSFCDWSLLEKIAAKNLPIIASTAGVKLDNISEVVQFFSKRDKKLSLLHCVAQYPTELRNLQLNQIDLLKLIYPQITIGYSSHEKPEHIDTVKMAIAKGAMVFEKHVGLDDYKGSINSYSATPEQIGQWLKYAKEAFDVCGISGERHEFAQSEIDSLRKLSRGIFASKDIKKGESINNSMILMAIPTCINQLLPSDFSQNIEFIAQTDIKANCPIFAADVKIVDAREKVTR